MCPTVPASIARLRAIDSGRARLQKLNINSRPARAAAAAIFAASRAFIAGGFSQKTCLPALSAASVMGAWKRFGAMMLTASRSGSASISSRESQTRGMPKARAADSADSRCAAINATTSPPAERNPAVWYLSMAPAPTIPIRRCLIFIFRSQPLIICPTSTIASK